MSYHFEINKGINDEFNKVCLSKYNSVFISRVYVYSHYKKENIYSVSKINNEIVSSSYIVVKDNKHLLVLNKMTEISNEDAYELCKFLMDYFKDVHCVKFELLMNRLNCDNCFCCYNNSDVCVDLPEDIEQYNKRLGSKSRQHYKYYKKKIENDFENVEFVVNRRYTEGDTLLIDKLIELKNMRCEKIKVVNRASGNIEAIKKISKEYGYLSYIKVNDTFACILLFYLVGTEFYFEQTAFDENYSKYSVGRTALYWSIIDAIENKRTKFHFLWKGADYKNHYSATEYKLYDCYVFKSKGFDYYKLVLYQSTYNLLRTLKHSKIGDILNPLYKRIAFSIRKNKK